MLGTTVIKALEKVNNGGYINREEALSLCDAPLSDMLYGANGLREKFYGNRISLCAVINARSGLCAEDCAFCAQSARHKTGAPVYPMRSKEDIVTQAGEAREMKAARISIVTSGRGLKERERAEVCEVIGALRGAGGINPCASLGEIDAGTASDFKRAGLSRYHHNLECSERFFPRVCTTHRWTDRVRTVKTAREAGLEVCSGGIFGLGESWEDRVDLAFALKGLGVDSVPLNFLIPMEGTRLGSRPPLSARVALRIIALFRFIMPDREIRVAGGREFVLGELQSRIFFAGANGMMIGDYLTTKGRKAVDDLRMIERLGLRPV